MARLEIALRSPIAFHRGGPSNLAPPIDVLKAPPETVGITFEGREFVWHPPMTREWEGLGVLADGPMVSVVVTSDDDRHEAACSLQRFLSAVAFAFDQPVEDVSYGARTGSGETDPYHWAGHRAHQAFRTLSKHTAPASIEVESDPQLGVALAYYRESVNAASPFYRFLALWNVLSAVFDIEREALAGKGTPTPEAARRDAFIRREAPKYAWRSRRAAPVTGDLARYFREDARNAIAHVRRSAAREIDPDDPDERVRLSDDADWLHDITRAAVRDRWPDGVRRVEH